MAHLSAAVEAGNTIYLSGALAFTSDGSLSDGDVTTQTRIVLDNLEAVLAARGLDRTAIVKTTVWLIDRADFAAFDQAYAAFFGDHRPARATTICELALPGALVEIEAVAHRPD